MNMGTQKRGSTSEASRSEGLDRDSERNLFGDLCQAWPGDAQLCTGMEALPAAGRVFLALGSKYQAYWDLIMLSCTWEVEEESLRVSKTISLGPSDQEKRENAFRGGLGSSVPKQNSKWEKPPISPSTPSRVSGLSDGMIYSADGSASSQV